MCKKKERFEFHMLVLFFQYGVIFDAGSSHTDITVYRWPSEYKDHGTAHAEQVTFNKCSGM